jgi:hypothetical protein
MGKADVKSARERRLSRDCDLTVGVLLAGPIRASGTLEFLSHSGPTRVPVAGRLCTDYAPPTIGLTVTSETRLSKEKEKGYKERSKPRPGDPRNNRALLFTATAARRRAEAPGEKLASRIVVPESQGPPSYIQELGAQFNDH